MHCAIWYCAIPADGRHKAQYPRHASLSAPRPHPKPLPHQFSPSIFHSINLPAPRYRFSLPSLAYPRQLMPPVSVSGVVDHPREGRWQLGTPLPLVVYLFQPVPFFISPFLHLTICDIKGFRKLWGGRGRRKKEAGSTLAGATILLYLYWRTSVPVLENLTHLIPSFSRQDLAKTGYYRKKREKPPSVSLYLPCCDGVAHHLIPCGADGGCLCSSCYVLDHF